jgi:hypothetical protein
MNAAPHVSTFLAATLAFALACSGGQPTRTTGGDGSTAADGRSGQASAEADASDASPADGAASGPDTDASLDVGATPTADAADAANAPDESTESDAAANATDATDSTNPAAAANAADATDSADAPGPSFGSGIFYRQPNLADPSALLARVAPPLQSIVTMSPPGFDVRAGVLVFPYPQGLVVVDPSLQRRQVPTPGLYGTARPSLSPDGRRAVLQASQTPGMPPPSLDIFVVSLDDGTSRKISNLPYNQESPRWFPQSNRIAYSSFSPTEGVNLHVYDLDLAKETLFIHDGGALQIAISPDEKTILDFWRLRAYDVATGAVVSDLRSSLEAALPATGYATDTAHPGMGGRLSFVLDGSFSIDGASLVIDGAVTRGATSGSALFTTPLAQIALTAVTPIIALNYSFSNQNNFSQLNPTWR